MRRMSAITVMVREPQWHIFLMILAKTHSGCQSSRRPSWTCATFAPTCERRARGAVQRCAAAGARDRATLPGNIMSSSSSGASDRRPASFRLGVVGSAGTDPNKCSKCVVDSVIVAPPRHEDIARLACNKLRLLKGRSKPFSKHVELSLRHAVREHAAGTVLPTDGDLSAYLSNDAVVVVRKLSTKPERPLPATVAKAASSALSRASASSRGS